MDQLLKFRISCLEETNINSIADYISMANMESDDFDIVVQQVPILINQILDTTSPDWCFDKLVSTSESDFKKYALIITSLGYYSDGFPIHFLLKVKEILFDEKILPKIRGILAIGSVKHDVIGREDKVYDVMNEICHYCMGNDLSKDFVTWFSSNSNPFFKTTQNIFSLSPIFDRRNFFSGFLIPIIKRKKAFEQYKNGNLIIPESLLRNALSGKTKGSQRFLTLGFNASNQEIGGV
jgi:hypothetical protein